MTSAFAAARARYAGMLLLVTLITACSDDATPPSPRVDACKQVNAKRRSCGVAELDCKSDFDACFAECLMGFGCAEQAQPYIDPGLTACSWACAPRFTCNDGSEIYDAFRCDGEGDCRDSEDEEDCPTPGKGGETGQNPFLPGLIDASTDGGSSPLTAGDAASIGNVTDAGTLLTDRFDAAGFRDAGDASDAATSGDEQGVFNVDDGAAPNAVWTAADGAATRASSEALE